MLVKYVFVTNGVVSSLGKEVTIASLGRLLKARGHKVTMQRFDPYINIDPSTMNSVQHGEVFVTDDSAETDLDLGHYERFIDENLTRNSNVTTNKVYRTMPHKGRHGDSDGGTVQVTPHITNEVKSHSHRNYPEAGTGTAIIEIDGTIGNIESQPFLETIRQFQHEVGPGNICIVHVALIPHLKVSDEPKTKPTQTSAKDLQGIGIQPDILVCRSEQLLGEGVKDKITPFYSVPPHHVLQDLDVDMLCEVPFATEQEHLVQSACEYLNLPCPEPDLVDQQDMIGAWRHPKQEVAIALVGRYVQLHDAYIPVVETLEHEGVADHAHANIRWVDSETVTEENAGQLFGGIKGILAPGGLSDCGIDGRIYAIQYVREHNIPFLGFCLGMQLLIVEFTHNMIGYRDAHSVELNSATTHPVICLMPEQDGMEDTGNTLGLGSYPYVLDKSFKVYQVCGQEIIHERHRHRYEIDNGHRQLPTQSGMKLSGISPGGRIVGMVEIPSHPRFIATQAHLELKSRSNRPHPLFRRFIETALNAG